MKEEMLDMDKRNAERSRKTFLIKVTENNIMNFSVKYELFFSENNKFPSYDMKLTKYIKSKAVEEATVIDFEWREKQALRAFDKMVTNEVTPMCLEACILELI